MAQVIALGGGAHAPAQERQDYILLTHCFSEADRARKIVRLCIGTDGGQRESTFRQMPPRLTAPLQRWIEWAQDEAKTSGFGAIYLRDLTEEPALLAA